MRTFIISMLLLFSANTRAIDVFTSATNALQMDGVVANGTQYNNVNITLQGYTVNSVGSNSTPYPATNTSVFPNTTAACQPSSVPSAWLTPQVGPTTVVPTPLISPLNLNAITLVLFRHGEKGLITSGTSAGQTVPENGNMSSIGQIRAQLLPARLNSLFGCPNYIIAPNPSGLIAGTPTSAGVTPLFYYERPSATIEPTATTLGFPIWMPYSFIDPQALAFDLLTNSAFAAPGNNPNTVFVAWEHNNILNMANYLQGIATSSNPAIPGIQGMQIDPPGSIVTGANGINYMCEAIPSTWHGCDYDSIWVMNIHGGNRLCYTHRYENLNNTQYQSQCN